MLEIDVKEFFKLPNCHMLLKHGVHHFTESWFWDFWCIANNALNKDKSVTPPLFSGFELLSSASDKAKLFTKNFSKNSNLHDSSSFLPVFLSTTNLKLHDISVTPKMVKKVMMSLDSSKTSGPDCIPVVFLKNCEWVWTLIHASRTIQHVPERVLLVFFLWLVKSLKKL